MVSSLIESRIADHLYAQPNLTSRHRTGDRYRWRGTLSRSLATYAWDCVPWYHCPLLDTPDKTYTLAAAADINGIWRR